MIRKITPMIKPKNPVMPVTSAQPSSPPAASAAPDVSSAINIPVKSIEEIGSKKHKMDAVINNRFHACFEEFDLNETTNETMYKTKKALDAITPPSAPAPTLSPTNIEPIIDIMNPPTIAAMILDNILNTSLFKN